VIGVASLVVNGLAARTPSAARTDWRPEHPADIDGGRAMTPINGGDGADVLLGW